MMSVARIGLVVAAGALAASGVALGAAVQNEEILHTDLVSMDAASARNAAGTLTLATALITALAAGVAFWLLSALPRLQRVVTVAVAAFLTYVVVVLAQTAFPSYVIVERSAMMSLTLLATNTQGGAGVMGPVLVVAWCAVALLVLCVRRLVGRTGSDAVGSHHAWSVAALPFLAAGAWGPLEILFALPRGSSDALGHSIVLGLEFTCLLGLLAATAVADHNLARMTREPRLYDYCLDRIVAATRVQQVLAAGVLVLALAGASLASMDLEVLFSGTTFGTSLRSHHVLVPLLLLPILPSWWTRRRALASAPTAEPLRHRAAPMAAAAFVLAGIATWTTLGALWPWLAAAAGVAAGWPWNDRASTVLGLWSAYLLWAAGNTITASFHQTADITIRFGTSLGAAALLRIAATVLAALVFAKALLRCASDQDRGPVAYTAGGLLGLGMLLEMSLAAWTLSRPTGEAVGLGSLPASQDTSVQVIIHILAIGGSAVMSFLVARLLRPEWFRRTPASVDASTPARPSASRASSADPASSGPPASTRG